MIDTMKASVYGLILLSLLLLNNMVVKAQSGTHVNKFNQTDIGIPIKKIDFDRKVGEYLQKMSAWTKFNTGDYIEMVKIYNTIGGDLPIKNDFYKMYYTVFLVMYSKLAAKDLDAGLSKGMAMYSKKYNLWLGDVPLGNDSSRFKIDTLQ